MIVKIKSASRWMRAAAERQHQCQSSWNEWSNHKIRRPSGAKNIKVWLVVKCMK